MEHSSDLKIEIVLSENKKVNFKYIEKVDEFYSPFSRTLGASPQMWFSHETKNDLGIEIYLKGNEEGIDEESIQFLNHFYEKKTNYIEVAINGLMNFGNIDWYKNDATVEDDWSLLSILYFGNGQTSTSNFGLAFYPNNKKWIDVYCEWFVTFCNGRMVGVNRVQC